MEERKKVLKNESNGESKKRTGIKETKTKKNIIVDNLSLMFVVSVQPASFCPHSSLPHLESQILFSRFAKYQTMLQQAAIVINPAHFPGTRFINIVIIPRSNEDSCRRHVSSLISSGDSWYSNSSHDWDTSGNNSERKVTVSLRLEVQDENMVKWIWLVLGMYFGGFLLAFALSVACHRYYRWTIQALYFSYHKSCIDRT